MTVTEASLLAVSTAEEWAGIVTSAIVGTDRRPAPAPGAGWDAWASSPDNAVALLDRALAVVVARRAGARPARPPTVALPPAPHDERLPCPQPCAIRLQRLLAGEHEVLLPEWFRWCDRLGAQLPLVLIPTLLLRGRRNPGLDHVVRRLAQGHVVWLAEVMPELGVSPRVVAGAPDGGLEPQAEPADGGAAVAAMVGLFLDGMATWAAAPQLRQVVAGLDPSWLPTVVVELSRLSFRASTERTRSELVALAEFRSAMLREFADARAAGPRPANESDLP